MIAAHIMTSGSAYAMPHLAAIGPDNSRHVPNELEYQSQIVSKSFPSTSNLPSTYPGSGLLNTAELQGVYMILLDKLMLRELLTNVSASADHQAAARM